MVTNIDSEPEESFYGPKIPRTKKDLKRDGEVVDTNFLAWLATMKEANADSNVEWEWDGEGWQSGFDEYCSHSLGNRSDDSILGGVISSIIPEPRRRFSFDKTMELMDEISSSSGDE